MGKGRIKTAAQWLAEVAARETMRAAMRWIWSLIAPDSEL